MSKRIVVGIVLIMSVTLASASEWPKSVAEGMELPDQTDGSFEVRLWVGGGITLPFELYRIRSTDTVVTGERIYWYELPRSGTGKIMKDDARDVRRFYRKQYCLNGLQQTNDVIWCSTPLVTKVDWSQILESLEVDKLWALPPQDSLGAPPCDILDGVGIGIELIQGDRYHHVVYWNPGDCCPWKECSLAGRVLKTCMGLH